MIAAPGPFPDGTVSSREAPLPRGSGPPRSQAAARGAWGEHLAEAVLGACGYVCLDRRFRIPGAEIDLVMRREPYLVFVEVKTRHRRRVADPECFLPPQQRRRIRQAALAWLAANPGQGALRLRFDVVAIIDPGPDGGVELRHLPNAF